MANGVRDLRVWQEAVALAADVVRLARQVNRRELRALIDDLLLAAVGTAAAIADGYAREDPAEQRHCYRAARRALSRLDTALAIARQAELCTATVHAQLSSRSTAVGRLLAGYLQYVDRQIAAERETPARA